jgi:hypothetical protein
MSVLRFDPFRDFAALARLEAEDGRERRLGS